MKIFAHFSLATPANYIGHTLPHSVHLTAAIYLAIEHTNNNIDKQV